VLLADVIERPTTPAIVRATAVGLIAQYGSQRSVAAQHKALRDADPLVRMAAVRALSGGPSPEEVVRLLGEKLSDPVRAVRLAAVQRLVPVGRDQLPTQHREPFDRALAEYRGSQQLTSERAHPHINLGWLERQLGNLPESAKQFRAAIRMEPYLAGPRSELANMLATSGGDAEEIRKLRSEEATLLERDTALVPDGSDIYYRLGLLRFQLGELDAAAAALEKACELVPVNYEYRMALALLDERRYEQGGEADRYNAAIASLRKLHAQDPNDPRAQQILERLVETRRIKEAASTPDAAPNSSP
jgi:tetratricopeptide (TPR) repeat protein